MQLKKDFPYGMYRILVMIANYKSIVKDGGILLLLELKIIIMIQPFFIYLKRQ